MINKERFMSKIERIPAVSHDIQALNTEILFAITTGILVRQTINIQKLILVTLFAMAILPAKAGDLVLYSPNRDISVEIFLKEKIYYSVTYKGERVMDASPLTLSLENEVLGANPKALNTKQTSIDEIMLTVLEPTICLKTKKSIKTRG